MTIETNDCLQQVEDYVRGHTWQLKKVKTIYRFHKLVFHRRDSSVKCFNWATKTMGGSSRFQSDIVQGKNVSGLCWVLQGGIIKDKKWMFRDCLNDGWSLLYVPWLSQWWLKSCSVIVLMMAEVLFRYCLNDGWSLMHVPWLSQWWLKSCSVIVLMMAEVMYRDCLNDGWSLVPWLSQWWLKSCSVIVSMMAEV
jgi:hypothetical protein